MRARSAGSLKADSASAVMWRSALAQSGEMSSTICRSNAVKSNTASTTPEELQAASKMLG